MRYVGIAGRLGCRNNIPEIPFSHTKQAGEQASVNTQTGRQSGKYIERETGTDRMRE